MPRYPLPATHCLPASSHITGVALGKAREAGGTEMHEPFIGTFLCSPSGVVGVKTVILPPKAQTNLNLPLYHRLPFPTSLSPFFNPSYILHTPISHHYVPSPASSPPYALIYTCSS